MHKITKIFHSTYQNKQMLIIINLWLLMRKRIFICFIIKPIRLLKFTYINKMNLESYHLSFIIISVKTAIMSLILLLQFFLCIFLNFVYATGLCSVILY